MEMNVDDPSDMQWVKPICRSKARFVPNPRSGQTLTVIGATGYLFGGLEICDDEARPTNMTHLLRMGSAEMNWEILELDSPILPLPRWKHTATLFDQTQILLFGGSHSSSQRLNDIWVFDAVTMEWLQPNARHNEISTNTELMGEPSPWLNVPSPRSGFIFFLFSSSPSSPFILQAIQLL